VLVSRTIQGYVMDNVLTSGSGWRGWCHVPGSEAHGGSHNWMNGSWPSLSSWGPGRLELFINTVNRSTGNLELSHTWADNGNWANKWEVLGTGLLSGSPSAVSWGPGRTDVFVRAANNGLAHKYFANGRWSGWEDTGAFINSSPSVTSWGPNRLDVFARGVDNQLDHRWYDGGWSSWEGLGGVIAGWSDFPPAAVSSGSLALDIFVVGADGTAWYEKSYYGGWYDFQYRGPTDPFGTGVPNPRVALTYWNP
jgi:hypothetical protein